MYTVGVLSILFTSNVGFSIIEKLLLSIIWGFLYCSIIVLVDLLFLVSSIIWFIISLLVNLDRYDT